MERGSWLQPLGVLIADRELAIEVRELCAARCRARLALDGSDRVALQLAELMKRLEMFVELRVVASEVACPSRLQLDTAGWLSRERTARTLGVSKQWVSHLVRAGGLRGLKRDGRVFVDPASVDDRKRKRSA